ncbi:hypothetical protein CXB51_007312 [Gossypium anomalum]|uniref:Uncharacterized protein n=1 Tax=Gossypium anomalum TaxID=47600 RepID=A0A8J5ZC65_9ROSI|nr:hypothetical protein CXB51_007312 [Gossypium anomalum]
MKHCFALLLQEFWVKLLVILLRLRRRHPHHRLLLLLRRLNHRLHQPPLRHRFLLLLPLHHRPQ